MLAEKAPNTQRAYQRAWDDLRAYAGKQPWEMLSADLQEWAEDLGDRHGVARTLNNLGLSYRALEQWNEAEESLRESLRLKGTSGDEVSLAASLLNLGFLLLDRGQLEEAEESARSLGIGDRVVFLGKQESVAELLAYLYRLNGDAPPA